MLRRTVPRRRTPLKKSEPLLQAVWAQTSVCDMRSALLTVLHHLLNALQEGPTIMGPNCSAAERDCCRLYCTTYYNWPSSPHWAHVITAERQCGCIVSVYACDFDSGPLNLYLFFLILDLHPKRGYVHLVELITLLHERFPNPGGSNRTRRNQEKKAKRVFATRVSSFLWSVFAFCSFGLFPRPS